MSYLPNTNADAASSHPSHVSHFGVLKTGSTIPVMKANFPGSSLDTQLWTETTANSGTVTVADGMGRLRTSTNTAGSAALDSVSKGRFEAGQVTVFQSGVRMGVASASNTKIWGLRSSDGQEGLYFKMNGTTFQVVAKKGGTETAVSSGSFSGDNDFTPGDTNNTYRIEYSAGRAIFYRANGGKKQLLHEMVDTAEPLVNDLDLPLYYENTNSGSSTDSSMYVRGASSSVWGQLQRFNTGGALLVSDFDAEVALGNVSKYTFDEKFGRVKMIDAADSAVDIWAFADDDGSPRSNTLTYPSSAGTIYITSSSGSDTDVDVTVEYIDSTGAAATATVNTDGQTPVSIGATGLAVNRMYVHGSTAPVGKLYATDGNAFTAGVPDDVTDVLAYIPVGYNQTHQTQYMVPLNHTLEVKDVKLSISRASGAAGSADVTLRQTNNGVVERIIREFFPTTAVPVVSGVKGIIVPARATLVWRVDDVSDGDTNISCVWDYILVED